MVCPNCKNKGWKPSDGINSPLRYDGKDSYDTVNFRRVICRQCGYHFITEEKFSRPVDITYNKRQEDLFGNGRE